MNIDKKTKRSLTTLTTQNWQNANPVVVSHKTWSAYARRSTTNWYTVVDNQTAARSLTTIVSTRRKYFISSSARRTRSCLKKSQFYEFYNNCRFPVRIRYSRQEARATQSPAAFLTNPAEQMHPGTEQIRTHEVTSKRVHVIWHPSFPHCEYISLGLVHTIEAAEIINLLGEKFLT